MKTQYIVVVNKIWADENPSIEVQMEAVRQNRYAIEYIKNPSKEVQLAAQFSN